MGISASREVVYRAVTALAVVVGVIVSCEHVARWLHPEATRAAILERIERERYRWKQPDVDFHHVGNGIYSLRFPSGEDGPQRRVMIVGDSFAMGHGVGEQERFGALLQRSLGDSTTVDVLAASSYSPVVYRNIVDRALDTARYAAVAVFVDQTDPADDLIYRHDLVAEGESRRFDVELMQDRDRILARTYDGIESDLRGWKGLARRLAMVNLVVPPPTILTAFPPDNRHYPYVELSLARWELVRVFNREPDHEVTVSMESRIMRHMDEIVERCRREGVPLLLAANPWRLHVTPPTDPGQDPGDPVLVANRLERLLEVRYAEPPEIYVIPLTEAFRRHPAPNDLYLGGGEIHWSREGHAEVERTLRDALRPLVASGR